MPHLSDNELIRSLDGELSRDEENRVDAHLTACWTCRTRKRELESAIGSFVHAHREEWAKNIPDADGPRALLRARLHEIADEPRPWFEHVALLRSLCAAVIVAGCVLLVIANWGVWFPENYVAVLKPNPALTPGATVLVSTPELCRGSNTKNKDVPAALQRRIFDEYGIHTRKVNSYEVDYLITPALGGADDIHNLWPQSRATSPWNAAAKDELEDHLHDLVCDGEVDLAVAQHDMAADWIEAYKKYFHTDRPAKKD